MAFHIRIQLRNLKCLAEDDGVGASEPYIWAYALATADVPKSYQQALECSRVIIKDGMRKNEIVPIPLSVGEFGFDFSVELSQLSEILLIVTLLEEDFSNGSAITKGLAAYNGELTRQIVSNKDDLRAASAAGKQEEVDRITENISHEVTSKVVAAILSDESRFKDHDDSLATAFLLFSRKQNDAGQVFPIHSQGFDLSFVTRKKLPAQGTFPERTVVNNNYQIEGYLEVRPAQVNLDLCQSRADAVIAAQAALGVVKEKIQLLQSQLQNATAKQKSALVRKIQKLEDVDLPKAEKILALTIKALADCRSSQHFGGGVVHTSASGGIVSQ